MNKVHHQQNIHQGSRLQYNVQIWLKLNLSEKMCVPDTWPQTRMPNVAPKPKAKLTVMNMPWEPPLNTSWATEPQPNIWREREHNKSLRIGLNNMLCTLQWYTVVWTEWTFVEGGGGGGLLLCKCCVHEYVTDSVKRRIALHVLYCAVFIGVCVYVLGSGTCVVHA